MNEPKTWFVGFALGAIVAILTMVSIITFGNSVEGGKCYAHILNDSEYSASPVYAKVLRVYHDDVVDQVSYEYNNKERSYHYPKSNVLNTRSVDDFEKRYPQEVDCVTYDVVILKIEMDILKNNIQEMSRK